MSRKTRKLIWSAPLVAVLAVVGALAIFAAMAPSNAAAQDDTATSIMVPGPSLGLDVEALSQYSIRLSWTVPMTDGAPTYYRIDQSSDKAVWERLVERVNVADVVMRGTDVDGNPRVGYVIEEDITPKTQQYYRVYAGNAAGDGPQSNEPATVYIDVGESFPATALGTFTLSGSSDHPTKVNLSWTSAPNPRGAEITGYRVAQMVYITSDIARGRDECPAAGEYGGDDVSCLYIAADDQGTGRTAMHADLTADTVYHYQVIAQVDDADAARSNIVPVRTAGANDPTTPRYPVAVPVGQIDGASAVNLYWVEPTDTGGLNLQNPDIQYQVRRDSGVPWPQGTNAWLDIGDTSTVTGAIASAIAFTTDGNETPATITDLDNITQGMVGTPHNAGVTVSNAVTDPVTTVQYRFRIRSKQATTDQTSGWIFFNSANGVEMQPDIAADIPDGPGMFEGEPLSGSTANEVGIRLTWNAPVIDDNDDGTNNRPPAGDYRIDWSEDGLKWQRGQVDTLRIREWKHRPLANGAVRYYRIFSKNSIHYSEAVAVGMTAGTLQASGAATDELAFTAEGISSSQIKLTWNDLDNAGCYNLFEAGVNTTTGEPFDDDPNADGVWDQLDANGVDDGNSTAVLTYTHVGLAKGELRWYRIDTYGTASNGTCDANTAIDDASGITVLGQTKDEVGRFAAPLNLVAEVAKDSSGEDAAQRGVLLQWLRPLEAAGVDDPAGYAIQVSTDDGLNWAPVTGNTGTTDTIYRHASPLVGDEQRIYQVRSASSDTTILSDWGNESHYPPMTATPQPPAFSAPSGVDAMSASGIVTISWTPGDSAMSQVVIAVNAADDTDYCLAVKAGDASSHTCDEDEALTVGTSYVILVIALDGQGSYMLGNFATHMVQ